MHKDSFYKLYPVKRSKCFNNTLFLCLKITTKIPKPIAASAAATAISKGTAAINSSQGNSGFKKDITTNRKQFANIIISRFIKTLMKSWQKKITFAKLKYNIPITHA